MKDLSVALIQSPLIWENKKENISMFSEKISQLPQAVDLIVLPEMFSTGFTMQAKLLAETMQGETMQWLQQTAEKQNCVIAGSFVCEENGNYFNRLIWMRANGAYEYYDKRHLFSMGEENKHYKAGDKKIVVELNGWRFCPLICYDLRFPIWCRNTKQNPYDVLLYVANWPERRAFAWKTILPARAIENQCYVLAVNRVGEDGNQISHSGNSMAINAKGETIQTLQDGADKSIIVKLNYEELQEFRHSFPVLNDAD
jgi:omega-amidase